jgi:hypothetical protein
LRRKCGPREEYIESDLWLAHILFSALFFFLWLCSPARAMASSSTRFLDHTQRCATVVRNPLDEWNQYDGDEIKCKMKRGTYLGLKKDMNEEENFEYLRLDGY